MKRSANWMEKLALRAQLEEEVLPGQSLVEMYGDSRLLIEHHNGVTLFAVNEICVRLKFGDLQICGNQLQMEKMSDQILVITGRIDSLCVTRRGKKC